MNYLVIDTDKGTILKIGENGYILRGYRGFEEIDVVAEYDESRLLKSFDPISVRRDSRYAVCSTNLENSIAIVFAKIIDFKIKQKTKENGESTAEDSNSSIDIDGPSSSQNNSNIPIGKCESK